MALAISMAVGMTGACGSEPETPSTATNQPTASEEKSANSGKQSAEPSEQPTNSATVVPLHVKGAKLLDEQNHPRQLRGVSTHGIAWFPQYVNAELFGNLKREWGINTVRLAMYTGEEGGYTTNGNKEELRKLVHQGVDAAIKQDLYVIVDWHTLSDNNPLTSVDAAKRFFDEMSHDYAGKPNVIYEICNEPNGTTTWAQVKQYAEQIIPVIRANDKNALILVGTPNWCQNIGRPRRTRSRVPAISCTRCISMRPSIMRNCGMQWSPPWRTVSRCSSPNSASRRRAATGRSTQRARRRG